MKFNLNRNDAGEKNTSVRQYMFDIGYTESYIYVTLLFASAQVQGSGMLSYQCNS